MEPGLWHRIARALLYPFVNSSWAWRQALPERSHETPLALSSRPPHTLQLEEYITSHFYHHYWRISFRTSAIFQRGCVCKRQTSTQHFGWDCKVRLSPTALWMSPLLCVCFCLCWSYTFSVCGIEESWKIATCAINYCFHPSNIENARYEAHTPLCCPI